MLNPLGLRGMIAPEYEVLCIAALRVMHFGLFQTGHLSYWMYFVLGSLSLATQDLPELGLLTAIRHSPV